MGILTTIDNVIAQVEIDLADLPHVNASKIGLDVRAGYVYVDLDERCIIVESGHKRNLEYYGGFEYIDDEDTVSIGEYKVYTEESSRVADALDYFEEHQEAT